MYNNKVAVFELIRVLQFPVYKYQTVVSFIMHLQRFLVSCRLVEIPHMSLVCFEISSLRIFTETGGLAKRLTRI